MILQGRNFTEYSQCVIADSVVQTTYLSASLMECSLPGDVAGGRRSVKVLERDLYYNAEEFEIVYRLATFVFDIVPSTVFREEQTEIQVYVSHYPQLYQKQTGQQFC